MVLQREKQDWSSYFIIAVTVVGCILHLTNLPDLIYHESLLNFFLLLALAAITEATATSLTIDKNKITYELGTAVSFAAIPFYGVSAGMIMVTLTSVTFWMIANQGKSLKERKWNQLSFNMGMHIIAAFVAGNFLLFFSGPDSSLLQNALAWISAAIIYDQLNLWLLILLLKLMRGNDFQALNFWRENNWAMFINVAILAVGGYLLALALLEFNTLGIIIFFLPILLSSYSFRLYVSKMQTHLNMLEDIISERTAELSALMEEKDAFLAILTHDMKTPLTTIGLYADILSQQKEFDPKWQKMFISIKRGQHALTEMVNNIVDLEKLEAGNSLTLNPERVDLVSLLGCMTEDMIPQAANKNIALTYASTEEMLLIDADKQQISRVFQNLISNAIKYTASGGQVEVAAGLKKQTIEIEIKDTGYGIPEEELPYIFDRFRRVTKHEHVAVGTGLGLAITKAIVEAHNGHIIVESQEGIGTTFTIVFDQSS